MKNPFSHFFKPRGIPDSALQTDAYAVPPPPAGYPTGTGTSGGSSSYSYQPPVVEPPTAYPYAAQQSQGTSSETKITGQEIGLGAKYKETSSPTRAQQAANLSGPKQLQQSNSITKSAVHVSLNGEWTTIEKASSRQFQFQAKVSITGGPIKKGTAHERKTARL